MSNDLFPECVIFILTVAFVISSIVYINDTFNNVDKIDCNHSAYCYEVK